MHYAPSVHTDRTLFIYPCEHPQGDRGRPGNSCPVQYNLLPCTRTAPTFTLASHGLAFALDRDQVPPGC
eukprot:8611975-Pyramimonas_sp.AAC.1